MIIFLEHPEKVIILISNVDVFFLIAIFDF